MSVVFNDRCDMIVATVVLQHNQAATIGPGVLDFIACRPAEIGKLDHDRSAGVRRSLRFRTDEDELEDDFAENSSGSDAPEAQKRHIPSAFSAGGAEGGEPLTSSLRNRSRNAEKRQ